MKPLRPYLYHAYYQWLIDNELTPYLLINATYADVDVPQEFVNQGKIILNISPRSVGQYIVNDEFIHFNARFQGILRDVHIPFGAVEAIYAQETQDGVMFQDEMYYLEENYLLRISKSEKISKQTKSNTRIKGKNSHLKRV